VTAAASGPRQKGSFLAKIQCGGRERDAFLASGRGQGYQSARLPAPVTTPRRSYHPSRIYFHPTRPAATLGGFSFGTSIFEHAQRRVPQGRGADSLRPQSAHARRSQIAKIAASIVEYGWTNPILVDGDNGIIAGHGRLAAARKLGLDQVPVIELAHLTVAQKRALVIADNRLALDAGWDEEMLALELAELVRRGIRPGSDRLRGSRDRGTAHRRGGRRG
jgi:hypothetical protein